MVGLPEGTLVEGTPLDGTEELGESDGEIEGFARVGLRVGPLEGLSEMDGALVSPDFVGQTVGLIVDGLNVITAVGTTDGKHDGDCEETAVGAFVAPKTLGADDGTKVGKEDNGKMVGEIELPKKEG